ncbi:hypothetical protein CoNPh17_CDS0033 [Staphylococcus phage S-CoN_Ph17]|nr:hypothetical protein CoNPh17_CDS0033 [Staphylococcus phage S-CoN_Ph17]
MNNIKGEVIYGKRWIKEKFEESYYELEEHKMNEFVGVDLGGGNYIDVKKTQGIAGLLVVNYVL